MVETVTRPDLSKTVLDWVEFKGTHPRGERRRGSVAQFVELLTTRRRAYGKLNAPGFSATRYRPHYTHRFTSTSTGEVMTFTVDAPACWRNAAGVESLSAWVGDLDHREPDWARLERTGNLVIAYSTWSHDPPANPCYRIVTPFAAPVAVECWPSVYAEALGRFEPHSDPACSSPGQLYWLPAGPPEKAATADIRVLQGELWSVSGVAHPAPTTLALAPVSERMATSDEQAAALRLLEATCRKLAACPEGGRQVAAYGHARFVGHLVAANAVDEQTANDSLWRAVECNGVALAREAETRRALARGLARGIADGAFVFDSNPTSVPLRDRPVRRVHRVEVR